MNKKKIDYRFKVLYAVAILMVVAGHCDGGGISLDFAQWFPYEGIHLALFTFCSGYFFKDAALKRPGRYVCKKLRTLILPMYGYTIAYGLLVRLLHRWGFQIGGKFNLHNILISPLNDGHQFVLNMAGWYIVPLFMVEILNCMIRAFFKRKGWQVPEWIFFAGAVLIGMGGNFLAIMEYRTSWWLTVVRILYFAPFYAMGIFYKKILEKYVDRIPSVVYFAIVFAAKLMIFLHYKTRLAYTPAWCNDFNQGPVMPIIIGFLGIALWMRIATIMEPVFGRKKWINLLSDNTFSIMENQFLGFLLVKVAFGTIANGTKLFLKFDWSRCKSDIWWYYMPKDVEQTKILYLLAAIFVALLIQWILTQVKKMGKNIFLYVRQ